MKSREASRAARGQWRVLAPALAAWAFSAVAITTPGVAVVGRFVSLALGLGLICWLLLSHKKSGATRARSATALLLVTAAILLLVSARIGTLEKNRSDHAFQQAAAAAAQVQTIVRVAGYPEHRESQFGTRAWVRGEAQTDSGLMPVMLWMQADASEVEHWVPGLLLEVTGRLTANDPQDPQAYGVRVTTATPLPRGSPFESVAGVAASLRISLVAASAIVPGAELVPGFAVGDTSLVSDELEEAMLESSLTHLVAVSGSNTGLVVAAVAWLASQLGAGLRLRACVAALGLAAFVLVVGPDASVQRATVMAAVMLVSGFGGKRGMALPALGLAVVVLLALNPWQALQPGFALSVAATGGILVMATPVTDWLCQRARLPRSLSLALAVAISAQFACGPLLLLMQPGVSVGGVIANVLAAPAAPLGTGLGLLAAISVPFSPYLAHLLLIVASVPAQWIMFLANSIAAVPFSRWNWPDGWGGALLLAACQFAFVLAWAIHRGKLGLWGVGNMPVRMPWGRKPTAPFALRSFVSMLIGASTATFIAIVLINPLLNRLAIPTDWVIVACDVGQGDALLVRDPRVPNEVMLVDTGDNPDALDECLSMFGVQEISVLVLSHDDRDHIGALSSVIQRVRSAVIAPQPRASSEGTREVVAQLEAAGVEYLIAAAGDDESSVSNTNTLAWRVVAPAAHVVPESRNASSLIMIVEVHETSILLLGDTGEPEQAALLRSGVNLQADVMKVAHHGSNDQSSELPTKVGAEWALISVGEGNGYGHPSTDTIAELVNAGTRILRTDLHGSVALVSDGKGGHRAWVEDTSNATEH